MSVDAVRAELAAVAREHERAADEWRTRALAAEAERDLLAGIIASAFVRVEGKDGKWGTRAYFDTVSWIYLQDAQADAIRRIIGEENR